MRATAHASFVLIAFIVAAAATAQAAEESAVRTLVPRWQQAWNAHDMKALGALFAEDADFVNVGARHWKGRAEIEAQHAARASQFADSVWSTGETTVQLLASDMALVHVTWGLKGDRNPDGTSREPREGVFTWLVVKRSGDWLIRAAQNTNRGSLPPSSECSFGVKFQGVPHGLVTLRFPDQPIRKVFDALEKMSGTPFRVPAELDQRVTFDLRDVTPCRALEVIAASQSLSYRQDGATIVVLAPAPRPPAGSRPN
jgi:uncharacterized protein (TIGR02246 family)